MKRHFFYLARCADDTLYSGTCIDLAAREAMHNCGKGAKYTRSRLPVTVVYHEEHPDLSSARRREIAVKRMTREQKIALIADFESVRVPHDHTSLITTQDLPKSR